MTTKPIAVVASAVPPRTKKSVYPPVFAARMEGRDKRVLGDPFGLTHFGVNLTTLAPGAQSALLHAHSTQQEFLFVLEGTNNMVNAINIADVAQKMVPETFALGGSSDDACDIDNLKHCCHFRFRLEHFAELYEPVIRDGHDCFVGFNGAEGIVLGGHVQVGKYVVGSGFPYVGESHDTHFEGVGWTAPKDVLFLLIILFLGRHCGKYKILIN